MISKLAGGEAYAEFWAAFGQTMKEGLIEDQQNGEKILKLLRFASTNAGSDAQDQSLDDYVSRMVDGQDNIYFILGESYETAKSSPHIEQLRDKGIEVLLLV